MSRSYLILFLFLVPWCSVATAQDAIDISILYDDATGRMEVSTNIVDRVESIRIGSNSGIFTGDIARGIYDQHHHLVQFPRGRIVGSDIDLGPIATPGLSYDFLAADLCVDASDEIGSLTFMGQPQPVTNERCDIPPDPTRPVGEGEKTVVFHYNTVSGNLFVDVGDNSRLTTLEITSPQGIFTGEPAQNLASVFDIDSDFKIFKLFHSGFEDIDFGNVVATGLTNNEFVSSICVAGSWLGGGSIEAEFQYPGAGKVPISRRDRSGCNGDRVPTDLNLAYDPNSGYFTVSAEDVAGGGQDGAEFTILQINSESGVFVGVPHGLDGPNDAFSSHGIIKQDPNGFSELDLGQVIKPGLDLDFLLADLSFDAILSDNSTLGDVRIVPEPSGLASLAIFCLWIGGQHRRRKPSQSWQPASDSATRLNQ